jgi:phage/plasmid-associated DNA primase
MYITLTNASPALRGQRVAIDSKVIVSIFRNTVTREDETIEDVTFMFCPPHGTWEVSETVEEIVEQLNASK